MSEGIGNKEIILAKSRLVIAKLLPFRGWLTKGNHQADGPIRQMT